MNFLSKRPREIGKLSTDYRPPEARAAEEVIATLKAITPQRELDPDDPYDYHSVALTTAGAKVKIVDLEPVNESIKQTRLDEIATLMRSLTYGEMMVLAAAVWNVRADGKEVTEQEMPGMMHRWSAK